MTVIDIRVIRPLNPGVAPPLDPRTRLVLEQKSHYVVVAEVCGSHERREPVLIRAVQV